MKPISTLFLASAVVLVAACSLTPPVQPPQAPTSTVTLVVIYTPTPTLPPATPTPTPEPLAALLNGEGIRLADFEAELARYRLAGTGLAEQTGKTDEQFVLDWMLDERLLAQAAAAQGYLPREDEIQARLDNLAEQVDLQGWMAAQGYDETSLRRALALAMQASSMRDQIAAGVPAAAEQVHAVQILLYNSNDAAEAYNLAQGADDFLELARDYNPTTGGEMGWFPKGSLFYPALEEAAFNLQPGTFSQVIQTELGYHILYIVERQADRPLDPEALRNRQVAAIAEWLANQRSTASITIYLSQAAP